jgi:predicted dehydrogenase
MNVGLIGFGYWGQILYSAISKNSDFEVVGIFDVNSRSIPANLIKKSLKDLFANNNLELCIIATPPDSHFELIKLVLENKSHCLVTKPLTMSLDHTLKLIELSNENEKNIFVDNTFLYTEEFMWIKQFLKNNNFGELRNLTSIRMGFGKVQNAPIIHDLLSHDIAIVSELISSDINIVQSSLQSISNVYGNSNSVINFENGTTLNLLSSWFSPEKVRLIVLQFDNLLIYWDHQAKDQKVVVESYNIENGNLVSTKKFSPWIGNNSALDNEFKIIYSKIVGNEQIDYRKEVFITNTLSSIFENSIRI